MCYFFLVDILPPQQRVGQKYWCIIVYSKWSDDFLMLFLYVVRFYPRIVLQMWYYVLKHQDIAYAQSGISQGPLLFHGEYGIIRSVTLETSHQAEVLNTCLQDSQGTC